MDLVKDPAGPANVTERADATRSFNKLHYANLRFDDFYTFGEKEIIQLVEPFCTHL